jgi:hypothetical protein
MSLGKVLYWMLSGGGVFAREVHRHPKWNLATRTGNVQFERVNRMLDRMIHPEWRGRYSLASDAAKESRTIAHLIEKDYRVVSDDLPARCTYCGMADYKKVQLQGPGDFRSFGLDPVGAAPWRIYACDHCGHIQWFRPDLAADPDVWNQ